jgi:sugar lactone lactonase YvrE
LANRNGTDGQFGFGWYCPRNRQSSPNQKKQKIAQDPLDGGGRYLLTVVGRLSRSGTSADSVVAHAARELSQRNQQMVKSQFAPSPFGLACVFVIMFCGFPGASELLAGPVQWSVAEGGNGHWYDLVMPDSPRFSYTWSQARAASDSMTWLGLQGYLATVTSPGEGEFLRDSFSSQLVDLHGPGEHSKYAWIGLFAQTPVSGFQWVTGEPLNFTDWAPAEPNFFGTPLWQCVHYWTRDFGSGPSWTWNNETNAIEGNPNIYGFFVEFGGGPDQGVPIQGASVPEPSSCVLLGLGVLGFAPRKLKTMRVFPGLAFAASIGIVAAGSQPRTKFAPGALYGSSQELNAVIHIKPDGSWESAFNVLRHPTGLAFRDSGILYVTGTGPNWPWLKPFGQMYAYHPDGSTVFSVPRLPVTNVHANGSMGTGLAIDGRGNAYVASHNSPGATKVTPDGKATDWTGTQSQLWWGRDAAFSPAGQLYMIQGLNDGPDPRSSVATIDPTTGAVTLVMKDLPFLDGIAFDKNGNMYLSEYDRSRIVRVTAGTTRTTPFASLRFASKLAIGPDGKLYALTNPPIQMGQSPEIWARDLERGPISLFAKNLPYLTDIAFSPSE